MTTRAHARSISCLCQLSPLRPARQDPPIRSRWITSGAVERRCFTSIDSPILDQSTSSSQGESLQEVLRPNRPSARYGWEQARPPLPYAPTYLDQLVAGIRRRDGPSTTKAFLAWTDILADETHPDYQLVASELLSLPAPVLSEILRHMDPIEHPELDIAHGLRITQGDLQFTDLRKLVNEHGVRQHHENVLEGMKTIMYLCQGSRVLLAENFNVFLRCAGAASDYLFATKIFSAMIRAGLRNERDSSTWKEFLMARYVLHPTYYQYDRARSAFNPRDLVTHQDKMEGRGDMIRQMDQIRYSEALFSRNPWNRQLRHGGYYVDARQILSRKATSTNDMYFYHSRQRKVRQLKAYKTHFGKLFRAKMRKMARRRSKWLKGPNLWSRRVKRLRRMKFEIWGRGGAPGMPGRIVPDARKLRRRRRARNKIIERFFRRINGPPRDPAQSFWRSYVKSIKRPNIVDEELICLWIQGFARSNDTRAVLSLILRKFYYIEVKSDQTVSGGKYFPNRSVRKPTSRLLRTIVEAFGSMSQIPLAISLVDHISQRWSIPISYSIWSNLLRWSFLAASKTNQNQRDIYTEETLSITKVDVQDVLKIWGAMTSPPYNVRPSFEDLEIYIKALIISQQFERAASIIRTSAVPYYNALKEEHTSATFNEVLLKDANIDPAQYNSHTISLAVQRRQDAEVRKDYVRNRICTYFDDLLKGASRNLNVRNSSVATELIPSLVGEFPHFFQSGIRYRVPSGYIELNAPENRNVYFKYTQLRMRHTLSSGLGSANVKETAVDSQGVSWKKHNNQGLAYRDKKGQLVKDKKFEWPTTQSLPVLEKRRMPRRRWDGNMRAPRWHGEEAEAVWMEKLRKQLMM